ncbi:MAG TPA: DUF3108 domain-containing protein [Geobacteraceae bacterium]
MIPFTVRTFAALCVILALLAAPLNAATVPERLVYRLSWTGIAIGTATQEIRAEGGTHRIFVTARSNDWLSVFFPVDDRIESVLDKEGGVFPGVSRSFRMETREGSHQRDREILFGRSGTAVFHDRRSGERFTLSPPPGTFDIYSSFFHVRYLPLEVGRSVYVNILDGKEVQRLEVRVLRRETLRTVLGPVSTIVVKPLVRSEGVFEGKGGVTIWLTDDARRIPVRVQTKVTVGSVTATLVERSP